MTNWIISCNLKQYDLIGVFSEFDVIEWKQSVNFNVGDIIYIYISHPIMELRYKCIVEVKDITNRDQKDIKYVAEVNTYEDYGRYVRLRKLVSFKKPVNANDLSQNGLNGRIQGPRRVEGSLLEFITNVEFKQKVNEQEIIESELDNELNIDLAKEPISTLKSTTIINKPKTIPSPVYIQGKKTYPRDKQVAINALIKSNHNCEVDSNHKTFISKYSNLPYMEAHHLIPLSYQDKFSYSLDIESNIISLCSHCHNMIHYGLNQSEIIERIYLKRKNDLLLCGIEVDIDALFSFYTNL